MAGPLVLESSKAAQSFPIGASGLPQEHQTFLHAVEVAVPSRRHGRDCDSGAMAPSLASCFLAFSCSRLKQSAVRGPLVARCETSVSCCSGSGVLEAPHAEAQPRGAPATLQLCSAGVSRKCWLPAGSFAHPLTRCVGNFLPAALLSGWARPC